ncbi:MAG TPA: DUF3465 domain-containing protein [Phycisphaerales bacterium]|nr:DUF3465 domain-containing protein [Phycisphaerales bacterium]
MASKPKKKAVPVTIGGVLIVVVLLVIRALGGPDLLSSPSTTSEQATSQRAVRVDPPAPSAVHEAPARDSAPVAQAEADDGPWPEPVAADHSEDEIRRLIDNQISGEMVELSAVVVKVLPDDDEGDRHQRFLLKLNSGGTILVAHNLDLAPRVPVHEGDTPTIFGQYEYNDRGGVLHWTHHAPRNNRQGGWIELDGKRYE